MNIETPRIVALVHRLSTLESGRPRTILSRLVPGARLSRPNEGAIKRVLIIKLSSIGDIVQALPVASALKRRFPTVRITWAVEDWAAPLIEHHPAIDRVAIFPRMTLRVQPDLRLWIRKFLAGARAIRAESYDVSIDLQGLLKSAVLAAISRGAVRIGVSGQREGAHLVSAPVPRSANARHAVDEYLDAACYLGAQPEQVEFGLAIDSAADASIVRMLSLAGVAPNRQILTVNPSASTSSKSWPAANWIALLRGIDGSIARIIVGGGENRVKHAAIASAVGGDVVDLTGRTTIPELVALLARSIAHVAPDTGSLHIAAALGRPVVGIYGPTPPVRLGPYGQPGQAIDHRELCGRWCPRVCVYARQCLRAVTPEEVREKIEVALSGESAGSLHAGPMTRRTAQP